MSAAHRHPPADLVDETRRGPAGAAAHRRVDAVMRWGRRDGRRDNPAGDATATALKRVRESGLACSRSSSSSSPQRVPLIGDRPFLRCLAPHERIESRPRAPYPSVAPGASERQMDPRLPLFFRYFTRVVRVNVPTALLPGTEFAGPPHESAQTELTSP